MYEIIGKCSICGGQVEAFVGPWFGTTPPRARCKSCGAVEARSTTVIPMVPSSHPRDDDWDYKKNLDKYYSYEDTDNTFKSFQNMMKELSDSFKWIKK
ncbi:MAG TPA: hypothetical protein VN922_13565 [Bacteroidia bacterium]|nr:hypothetical protein [Bacteroidia bacterium]